MFLNQLHHSVALTYLDRPFNSMMKAQILVLLYICPISAAFTEISRMQPQGQLFGVSYKGNRFVSLPPYGYQRRSFSTWSPLNMAVYESVSEVTSSANERMQKCIESVKKNLLSIRTGRANPSILDRVVVDYYSTMTPLNQLATISVTSSQQLTISPFDKSSTKAIEAAIIDSGLGLTPNNDGTVIRINIPPVTEARRKELMKQCKTIGEEGKVAVRNVRRDGVDAIKKMEKDKAVGEDESKAKQDELQKITDKYVKEIDVVVASKEKEVMTV